MPEDLIQEPITQEQFRFIDAMYHYQKNNNITGMRLVNALIVGDQFKEYKPTVGVVIILAKESEDSKNTAVIIAPHCWNQRDLANKLESTIDILQFGSNIGQYCLLDFLKQCKIDPLKGLITKERIEEIVREVVDLENLIYSVVKARMSVEELCRNVSEHSGDSKLYDYYKAIKQLHSSIGF